MKTFIAIFWIVIGLVVVISVKAVATAPADVIQDTITIQQTAPECKYPPCD
jgi:hypothetical protein